MSFPVLQWFEIDSNFHNWPEDCADDGHDDDDNIKDDDDDKRPPHHGEKQYTRTSSICVKNFQPLDDNDAEHKDDDTYEVDEHNHGLG